LTKAVKGGHLVTCMCIFKAETERVALKITKTNYLCWIFAVLYFW